MVSLGGGLIGAAFCVVFGHEYSSWITGKNGTVYRECACCGEIEYMR